MAEIIQLENFTCSVELILTDGDIDDIMCCALEGGITYWCDCAKVVGEYLGKYGHEQISRGGQLKLHDFEDDQDLILTREKFIEGFKKYVLSPYRADGILDFEENNLTVDCCMVDAEVADSIIQYALFGELIYG